MATRGAYCCQSTIAEYFFAPHLYLCASFLRLEVVSTLCSGVGELRTAPSTRERTGAETKWRLYRKRKLRRRVSLFRGNRRLEQLRALARVCREFLSLGNSGARVASRDACDAGWWSYEVVEALSSVQNLVDVALHDVVDVGELVVDFALVVAVLSNDSASIRNAVEF